MPGTGPIVCGSLDFPPMAGVAGGVRVRQANPGRSGPAYLARCRSYPPQRSLTCLFVLSASSSSKIEFASNEPHRRRLSGNRLARKPYWLRYITPNRTSSQPAIYIPLAIKAQAPMPLLTARSSHSGSSASAAGSTLYCQPVGQTDPPPSPKPGSYAGAKSSGLSRTWSSFASSNMASPGAASLAPERRHLMDSRPGMH